MDFHRKINLHCEKCATSHMTFYLNNANKFTTQCSLQYNDKHLQFTIMKYSFPKNKNVIILDRKREHLVVNCSDVI